MDDVIHLTRGEGAAPGPRRTRGHPYRYGKALERRLKDLKAESESGRRQNE